MLSKGRSREYNQYENLAANPALSGLRLRRQLNRVLESHRHLWLVQSFDRPSV